MFYLRMLFSVFVLTFLCAKADGHSHRTNFETDNTAFTQFVVDAMGNAPYTTIQSAVNAAIATAGVQTILVRPGSYTENIDFTGGGNLTLIGAVALGDNGQCEIIGIHNPPVSGNLILRNFKLSSATDIFNSKLSGTSHLSIIDALLHVTNGYTWNLPNWEGIIEMFNINDSTSANNGFVYNLAGATVNVFTADVGAGNGNPMVLTGAVNMQAVDIGCPVQLMEKASFSFDDVVFLASVFCNGDSSGAFRFCTLSPGSDIALIMNSSENVAIYNSIVDSSDNPSIQGEGSGTLSLGTVTFPRNSDLAQTLTVAYVTTTTGISNVASLQALGDIKSANGNVIIDGLAKGLQIKVGHNARMGMGHLIDGTLIVPNMGITKDTMIFTSRIWGTGTSNRLGELTTYLVPGAYFVINAINPNTLTVEEGDRSEVCWLLIEPIP